jgi:DNA polymerase-3 subunit beta
VALVKIRIEKDALADAVNWTARALGNSRTGKNIGLGIEAEGDSVVLVAYDRDISARAEIDAVVETPGKCVVPGRLLTDITKTLPSAPVTITLNDNNIDIVCGRSSFDLPTITNDDFPKMVELPTPLGTITGANLANAVSQVVIAAHVGDNRPNLTGIQFEFFKEIITLGATDTFRLALKDVEWNPLVEDPELAVLIPAHKVSDIAKGLQDCEKVEISLSTGKENTLIGFSGNGRSIAVSLLPNQFPKYRTSIPAPGSITAYVEVNTLAAAVRRVRLVLEDKDNSFIHLELGDNELTLTARGTSNGLASEVLDAAIDGALDGPILFDPNRLLEGLTSLNTPHAKFAFLSNKEPALLSGAKEAGKDDAGGYKYWLMPKPPR